MGRTARGGFAPSFMLDLSLPLDALVREIGVNVQTPHAFLLGAGASYTSGVPTAEHCVWEWKRAIFLTNNPGLEEQFRELTLASVRDRIQAWLDRRGNFPVRGTPEEYSFYIEQCYPVADSRRRYFQGYIQRARPHVGYRLLCHLAEVGMIASVWTPNFDALTARAAAEFSLVPVEIGIDCQTRLPRVTRQGELPCISLHGDYRYDPLKNTAQELQLQEADLRAALIAQLHDHPLIVVGYSGRDESLMQALGEAYGRPGPGALFWCGHSDPQPKPPVAALIESARAQGRTAYYVPTLGFDDLLTRVALHCPGAERARKLALESLSGTQGQRAPFTVADQELAGLIRSNAFTVSHHPAEVFSFEVRGWPEQGVWRWVQELTQGKDVAAVPLRRRILALGTLDGVQEAFGHVLQGRIDRAPISDDDLKHEDGAITSLLLQALVRALAQDHRLGTDGKRLLWDESTRQRDRDSHLLVYGAAELTWRRIDSRIYLTVVPTRWVTALDGSVPSEEDQRLVRQRVLGWQHNAEFGAEVDRWRQRLFGSNQRIEYPPGCGSTFYFTIRKAPVFAKLMDRRGRGAVTPNQEQHIRFKGTRLPEPKLSFAPRSPGQRAEDVHPMRGLLQNRPFDYALTQSGLMDRLRLGVVCPAAESRLLQAWLRRIHSQHQPGAKERDYLLPYPGFEAAFGLPMDLPAPGSPGWRTLREPDGDNVETNASSLTQSVVRALSELKASHAPHVVIVFIPRRWRRWTSYETGQQVFDLHDFTKAYAAQQGIATQFLEQDTIEDDALACRVWWWLSLAFYAKSMRTPWVLSSLDPNTAFVGLGFSIDRKAPRGQHVILGCSHLYNSQGEGIQYRLSRIENPVMRGRNPFMSRDDAHRLGDTIRQLFYEARTKLPERVVLHKRTPFLRDEREGLLQGLGEMTQVDMLEVCEDSALRFVSSQASRDGFTIDNYPVERGTVVVLEPHRALLWVHGVARPLDGQYRYFKGKRRIPSPLTIRRHAGRSDLALLAEEILGLSKMSWNHHDLYAQLPATLQSSGQIARIGTLLDHFGPVSYDYRLFI